MRCYRRHGPLPFLNDNEVPSQKTRTLVGELGEDERHENGRKVELTYALYFDANLGDCFVAADRIESSSNADSASFTHCIVTLYELARFDKEKHAAALEHIERHRANR